MGHRDNAPVRRYADPRVEIFGPTDSSPYFRVRGYDDSGRRVTDTTAGRTLRAAEQKAGDVTRQLREGRRHDPTTDPRRVFVVDEVERWLDPANHRTRENRPWSRRHADNAAREWRLRIEPELPRRATVADLDDKMLWVRILNTAQASGLSPASVQTTGQICRSLITWLMDRGLLDHNPMRGVRYTQGKGDNDGLDPVTVRPDQIPNLDMVHDLALAMAWNAWPQRPSNGGARTTDMVGPAGRALEPMLVATTGLRNGELFALRASKVDIGCLEIRIDAQLVEEDSGHRDIDRPKHGSIRTVLFAGFLTDDMEALIRHRRRASGERDPLLFCAPQGGWEWRRNHTRRFRAAARQAGWPDHLTWYGLRHLYAVTMLEALPLEVVSRLMGHHSPNFTAQRYLSLRTGWLDQARRAARDLSMNW